jgi:hypothetical protein
VAFQEVRKGRRPDLKFSAKAERIGVGAFRAVGCFVSFNSLQQDFLEKEFSLLDWGDFAGAVNNFGFLVGAGLPPALFLADKILQGKVPKVTKIGGRAILLFNWIEIATNAAQILANVEDDFGEGYYGRASLRSVAMVAQVSKLSREILIKGNGKGLGLELIQKMESRLIGRLLGRIGSFFVPYAGWIYTGVEIYIWVAKGTERGVRPILEGMWEAMDNQEAGLRKAYSLQFHSKLSRGVKGTFQIPGLSTNFKEIYSAIGKNLKANLWPVQPQSGLPHFKLRGWNNADLKLMFPINPLDLERIERRFQEADRKGILSLHGSELQWFLGIHLLA